ncbi:MULTISPECIES: molybdate ABC transporter substrate-binding protein [Pelosinus]|uniref:Molybdenum ABC transporter, periplasmic molybdate-binding protein n=2 Tax=Pelosinus TaxID=365348 RepID=I8RJ75_9FIRM|nr:MULTISPECIES: molybdate ABC transporter substrate-binding protein [Pelosinus]EIW20028.1 molybdenum ABC transporter, periplasmic molybdate-binding protein [Pelosinus fermentans B4]EIW26117.1 molybdenum ABC transporter, periplasmic molybdate-binding protein [Pelosinus fermentans A11]OAM93166.1 molybdenum ABC transporter, periplasmic molybdate-binding protein [Pelosinus fermentans DSM 17108]SDQ69069.1 molybdate transport system substrate-binding protein [Pelosinus fermentans]
MSIYRLHAIVCLIVCFMVLSFVAGCGNVQPAAVPSVQPAEINVSAAMGLKDALGEIQKKYEADHSVKIVFNLASSGALQTQIEQGAPADLFISAASKQMDELQKKNLIIPATRKNLVGNQLVLIVPKTSQLELHSFQDLTNASVTRFGMGVPETVPAGEYAKQVLEKLQVWETVREKAVMPKDIHSVLTYVETGNVEAGIVFSTVAAASDKVKVAAIAPANTHEPIIFLGAVVSSAKHPKEAEAFLQYLTSSDGMAVFTKYGFQEMQ